MIVMPTPALCLVKGRPAKATHLISTMAGVRGRRELLDFGTRIGFKPPWLKCIGTPFEHFELRGCKIESALKEGAKKVDGFRFVELLDEKRRGTRRQQARGRR